MRCGGCCTYLDVAIIDPAAIQADGRSDPSKPLIHKPAGKICPYLAFSGEVANCSIHHLPCYEQTPCQQFEQVGREDDFCILGSYLRAASQKRSDAVP